MQITVKPYDSNRPDEILPLYQAVGWTNYTDRPEMLEAAYRNSLCILGAYDKDKLVGVIRAVGDGVSIVFVQDLLVLPAYQRQGIGTKLLQAILERYVDVYQIELLTDNTAKTNAFYESLGLIRADSIGCRTYLRIMPPASQKEESHKEPSPPEEKPEKEAESCGSGFNKYRSPSEKIALFRALFRGREDVFARRWQSAKAERADIPPPVQTNGSRASVQSRRDTAPTANSGSCSR